MSGRVVGGVDVLAVVAGLLAGAMGVVYVAIVRAQGNNGPAWWVLGGLAVAAVLCLGSAPVRGSYRRGALLVAAGLLGVIGLLGILSIGVPILVAAVIALLAALLPVAVRPAG